MRPRPAPAIATWFLKLFCSSAEHEAVTGDLLEQYQLGRDRFWYWRQVLAIVFLGLYGKAARRPLVPAHRFRMAWGFALLLLLVAGLSAILLSDIWVLGVVGILGGVIAAILILGIGRVFGLGNDRIAQTKDAHSLARVTPKPRGTDALAYQSSISISHIPVEGAVGLLFVLASGLVFGIGVPAIREILVVTVPLGIIAAGILLYWHKRHPREIQGLDLGKRDRAARPR